MVKFLWFFSLLPYIHRVFINPKFFLQTESAPKNNVESIEKQIKGLEVVYKYAKTDNEKKIALNKINALKITLKYKKWQEKKKY